MTYHFTTAALLFFYNFNSHEYQKLSDFIPGATSKEKEYAQFMDITGKTDIIDGRVRLKITEELDETTYLDRVYLHIDGTRIIELDTLSNANKELLQYPDNKYLIMKEGDHYFLGFALPKLYDKIEFVAEGYYIEHYKDNTNII